jgi:hypothetical protein
MSLPSMYKRDDSRTVYRILAEQAVRFFDHPKPGIENKILFTNLARLLERYRYNAFSYDVMPGILEVFKTKDDTQRSHYGSASRNLDVIPALEAAHAKVYQALPKDTLVQTLETLLAQLAASQVPPDDARTNEDLAKARLFFVALYEGLKERQA